MHWHATLTSCVLIALCTRASIAQPPRAEPAESKPQPGAEEPVSLEKTFIRINTPSDAGAFTVSVEQVPGRDATRLTLIGKMWDAGYRGEGIPDDAWDAKFVFLFPDHSSDMTSLGPLRTWRSGQVAELYSAESLAPNAALWSSKTAPELGSIEVWNSDTRDHRLSDSAVVSLFHAMILPEQGDDQRATDAACEPSYGSCYNSARNACEHGIASFEYHCEEGSVTCKFSCRAPNPEPGLE